MGQVVRKSIAEKHPEINEKKIYTLLVDGNALLRRSFKDTKVNSEGVHYGGVFQFLLQLRMLLQKKTYDYIYVTFDGHNSGYLRYEYYNDYKANRDKDYANMTIGEKSDYWIMYEETLKKMQNAIYKKNGGKERKERYKSPEERFVDENFARERDILLNYFNELFIRWFFDDDDVSEGDDIIAYYVKNKKKEENIVIVTGDRDLGQLISDSVCIYDLNLKKYISKTNFSEHIGILPENVVTKKILLGDDSDNIKGINGLSENRLKELVPEITNKPITIEEVKKKAQEGINKRIEENKKPYKWQENIINGVSNGNYSGDFYEINRKIIDLSEPLLSEEVRTELKETMYAPMDPEGRSFNNLFTLILKDGIDELRDSSRFATFFEPFKLFTDKEIKRYKESKEK